MSYITKRIIQRCRTRSAGIALIVISKRGSGGGPEALFQTKIQSGLIKSDSRQKDVVKLLQNVYEEIQGYSPGFGQRYLSSLPPKGLYIYGSVGAGKTMLMDVFYSSVKMNAKRRVHFNDFMADVHSLIHADRKYRTKGSKSYANPFRPVARKLIKKAWLLCFDEFQVTDIGDAMILKNLFTELFQNGMVMVATSNRPPDDLYKDGLQRSNFIPFIAVLKQHCHVSSLTSPDYRKRNVPGIGTRYFVKGSGNANMKMDEAFRILCKQEQKNPSPRSLTILGRTVTFKKCCGRVLDANFSELCDKLAASDYLKIAENFDTVLIRDIPKMSLNDRNQVRRFILLIDTLYDRRIRIIVSAAENPQNLFSVKQKRGFNTDEMNLMDDLAIDHKTENGKSSIFTGSEEIFAFDRVISRLIEMSSEKYWIDNER